MPERPDEDFACEVCDEFREPPFYFCDKKHLICSSCKPENDLCPMCRRYLGESDVEMEYSARRRKFPCNYKSDGCLKKFRYSQMALHEKACKFQPYKYPFGCGYFGKAQKWMVTWQPRSMKIYPYCQNNTKYFTYGQYWQKNHIYSQPLVLTLPTMPDEDFACEVCDEFREPPFYFCDKKHLICSSCKPENDLCPMCRRYLGESDVEMEYSARRRKFPCNYKSDGCLKKFRYSQMALHQKACKFQPYKCPFGCGYFGKAAEMDGHLAAPFHENLSILPGNVAMFKFVIGPEHLNSAWYMLQKCFGRIFICKLSRMKISDVNFQFFLTLEQIGSTSEVNVHRYKMTVQELENPFPSYHTCSGTPHSVVENVTAGVPHDHCLVLSSTSVERYAPDGILKVKVELSKIR